MLGSVRNSLDGLTAALNDHLIISYRTVGLKVV